MKLKKIYGDCLKSIISLFFLLVNKRPHFINLLFLFLDAYSTFFSSSLLHCLLNISGFVPDVSPKGRAAGRGPSTTCFGS